MLVASETLACEDAEKETRVNNGLAAHRISMDLAAVGGVARQQVCSS